MATHDQARDVRTLTKQAGIAPLTRTVVPGDEAILELTGPAAPYVEPSLAPEPARTSGGGARRQRPASASRPARTTGNAGSRQPKRSREHVVSSSEARETTRAHAASGTTVAAAPRKGPRRAGAPQGPARTRAELAARAGQQPAVRRRASR
jgi:hypothetical protein